MPLEVEELVAVGRAVDREDERPAREFAGWGCVHVQRQQQVGDARDARRQERLGGERLERAEGPAREALPGRGLDVPLLQELLEGGERIIGGRCALVRVDQPQEGT